MVSKLLGSFPFRRDFSIASELTVYRLLVTASQRKQITQDPGMESVTEDRALTLHDADIMQPRADPPDQSPIDEVVGYVVLPRDGKNKTATDETDNNLKQLLGADYKGPGLIVNGEVDIWQVGNSKVKPSHTLNKFFNLGSKLISFGHQLPLLNVNRSLKIPGLTQ